MNCRPKYAKDGEPLTERHVQAVWYDRAMRPEALASREGERVRVLDPGAWNLDAGPDFKGALLEIGSGKNRRRLRGDVEVHLDSACWDRHGHGTDEAYSHVAAHVVWHDGPPARTLPPGAVTIGIGSSVCSDPAFTPSQIDLSAYPFARSPLDERPCAAHLARDSALACEVMAASGRRRLKIKALRLSGILASRPGARGQILYEEMMAGMGYRHNARAFRRVAELVPLSAIATEPSVAQDAFVVAAGFTGCVRRGRPSNSPLLRLRAAGTLFSRSCTDTLLETRDFSRRGCVRILDVLMGGGIMGRGRAAAILANVILPFAMAEGRADRYFEWLPAEDVSAPVRLAAFRLLGQDHNPRIYSRNGLYIQGLIQIHRELCLNIHPDCSGCPLVRGLADGGGI
ncbi:MAG: DUF2851 family protein [Kiritimatiellae bacterium]|nr:DUF2851 family protein [Kiritimatiellia bacterium]